MIPLAVYGTLKTGHDNYPRFLGSTSPIFSGYVRLPFRMFANQEYPMLVSSAEEHRIFVEVFEVDEPTLRRLDGLEAPYGYQRLSVHLAEIARPVEIYAYAGKEPPTGFQPVSTGRWETKQ